MTPSPSFAEFVRAVHGHSPFPWQQRMADLLLAGTPPQSITVPTGLGKTSVLDAWVWTLAQQADMGAARQVPTRAAFVVDRRVIVDAAFEHANVLSRALTDRGSDATRWAADRLLAVGHGLRTPLDVVRMRGGVSWSWRWLRQPDQPAVVAGTVDQFGSRFLFRGYGVGERLRPIDAALVGTDSIVFVDEAHLSTALAHTVRTCVELENAAPRLMGCRPPSIVTMSATPPASHPSDHVTLTIDDDDFNHPVAASRLAAVKQAELVDLAPVARPRANESLAVALADHAREIAVDGRVVLVVANTIDVARRVHDLLVVSPGDSSSADVHLAIGRCRNIDRDASRRGWWARAAAGRERDADRSMVVVATQTVEVGADLDVDALVTEAAPIDALVQRFGRVDRLGRVGTTSSFIIRQRTRSAAAANHVYGPTSDSTWAWLSTQGQSSIDFGLRAMGERLEQLSPADRADLIAPVAPIPEVYGEVLHQLARTKPTPNPDHPIETYLHGMRDSQPSVHVIWRAGSDFERLQEAATADDAPLSNVVGADLPTTAEAVEVPLLQFLRFLRRESGANASDLDNPCGPTEIPTTHPDVPAVPIDAIRIRDDRLSMVSGPRDIRHGDLVVVAAADGGHDEFGWTGRADDQLVPDVADLVRTSSTQLRLEEDVLKSLYRPDAREEAMTHVSRELVKLRESVRSELIGETPDSTVDDAVHALIRTLRDLAGRSHLDVEIIELLDRLEATGWTVVDSLAGSVDRSVPRVIIDTEERDDPNDIVIGRMRLVAATSTVPLDSADDSELGSSRIGSEVTLDQHLGAVGTRAAAFARSVGYPDEIVRAVELAGRAHDLGKVDPRFQTLLRDGDWLAAVAFDGMPGKALAKSLRRTGKVASSLRPEWRWPRGMRHEAVSVALLRDASLPEDIDSDLVEHLVASHHGWSRPLFPPVTDTDPRQVRAVLNGQELSASSDGVTVDWTQPARFRHLCETYGWWGLAALEATLRLADIAVSEEGS